MLNWPQLCSPLLYRDPEYLFENFENLTRVTKGGKKTSKIGVISFKDDYMQNNDKAHFIIVPII